MNILDLYLQQFIKRITKKSINDYKMSFLVNNQAIYCAEEIHDNDIDMIKSQLNDAESYYARIEADINLQSRMKITTEEAFHFIYHMSAVA